MIKTQDSIIIIVIINESEIIIIIKKVDKRNGLSVVFYSFSSGILACVVSVLIKVAFNSTWSSASAWLHTGICIALAFVANSLMWLLFSRSLALSDNTVYATGLNKLSNFVTSAFVGLVLFKERFDLWQWSFGIVLISLGLYLIASSTSQRNEKNKIS